MLPSQPKILHGRDSELSSILQLFSHGTPRIAILGAGGMGKTSLARAVIHHTEITERYNQHRFFIACDLAVTQVELAALIGAHVGLKPGKDLTHPVIQYFSSSSDSLLILDNLETLWEPAESRGKMEEFLSLLTGVDHLALLPLEQAAARQTFIDIADNTHDPNEVDKVLSLTDNMPLAISLIAHLVDSEGCFHVLSRWEEEKTSLMSDGYDRTSNFSRVMGRGGIPWIQEIHIVLPHPCDHHLEAYLIIEQLNSWFLHSISNPETLVYNALEHFKEFVNPDLKCRLYNVLTTYYLIRGDISSGKKFSRAAVSLALSTGNTKRHSQGLCNLACVEWSLGDYSAAQVHANEAQRLAIISADLYREALALRIEATCCCTFGNYTKAMSLCIRARDLLGLCAMSGGTSDHYIMTIQAEIHHLKSEYIESHSIHTRILEETTIQDTYNYGFALLNIAEIDVMIGAPMDEVQRDCDRARKMLDTLGDVEGVILCDVILADLYLREGNSLAANTIFKRCLKGTLEYSQIQTYCLERLGNTSYWGALDGMSSWTAIYLVNSLQRKEKLGIYKAFQFLGNIFLLQNDGHTAISLFTVALEGFTQMDVHRSRTECMLQLGDISKGHGCPLKAMELWERAGPLFERSSQVKQVQHIKERLAGINEDVLEQHKKNLAHLAELNALAGTMEELEDDLSDIEDRDKIDMGEEKELDTQAQAPNAAHPRREYKHELKHKPEVPGAHTPMHSQAKPRQSTSTSRAAPGAHKAQAQAQAECSMFRAQTPKLSACTHAQTQAANRKNMPRPPPKAKPQALERTHEKRKNQRRKNKESSCTRASAESQKPRYKESPPKDKATHRGRYACVRQATPRPRGPQADPKESPTYALQREPNATRHHTHAKRTHDADANTPTWARSRARTQAHPHTSPPAHSDSAPPHTSLPTPSTRTCLRTHLSAPLHGNPKRG
ncbi:hypothetical protein B0H13DRAFT_2499898 [Mycena leptocephala]|nr:hypothetical protein B0H13DRAFT_2499898 [Mycena leptocephala]